MPSTSPINPQPFIFTASPPAAPQVSTLLSLADSTMQQWSHLLATLQQDVIAEYQVLSQEIVQAVYAVQQQWGRFFGINLNPTSAASNSDSGSGRSNASGSGSGSNATAGHINAPQQGGMKMKPMTSGGGVTSTTIGGFGGFGSATVSGTVWQDSNGDGLMDNGEAGIAGDTVELLEQGGVVDTDITGAGGNYTLTDGLLGPSPSPDFEVVVGFPNSFDYATIGGAEGDEGEVSSDIDMYGFTKPFDLAAGDAVKKNAGFASMNVNTTADDPGGALGGGQVTLRDAIKTGNAGNFDPLVILAGGPPAVTFITNAQTGQQLSGTISLQAALPAIQKSYNISGPGSPWLTVNGNNNSGTIFTVNAGVTSTISGLTIMGGNGGGNGGGVSNNGNLTLVGDYVSNNQTSNTSNGGGIYNGNGAQLSIQGGSISQNTAAVGGGLFNYGTVMITGGTVFKTNHATYGGGAISNTGGKITVAQGTQIDGNQDTNYFGGAVENRSGKFAMVTGVITDNKELSGGGGGIVNSGTMSLTQVSIQGNQAKTQGGGIYVGGGKLTLRDVTLGGATENKAVGGGGMYINGGTVKMTSGAIKSNSATGSLVVNGLSAGGGGIYVSSGRLTLFGVPISNNNAASDGGGLFMAGGFVKVTGGTITNNQVTKTSNGGGIYVWNGSLTLTGNAKIVKNNIAAGGNGNGGGMYIYGGWVSMSGGSVASNKGAQSGGGIYNYGGSLTLTNNVQVELNDAAKQGGGMYFANGSTSTFIGTLPNPWNPSCVISGNTIAGQGTPNMQPFGLGAYAQNGASWNENKCWTNSVLDKEDPGGTPKTGA